ncbi:MAG: ShlB/FhaC/HecB family hemolysin secretion/activation protein [Gammaproteobacteria bacterium]|nr:ShlB/FhaC/HecB family hemolysin secretion/activation protein [Gammaproteobacteria bacterium]
MNSDLEKRTSSGLVPESTRGRAGMSGRSRLPWLGCILAALLFNLSVRAENGTGETVTHDPEPTFHVGEIAIEGENPLSRKVTAGVLEPFVDREQSIETLRELTASFEKALAVKGFNFYTAIIPPQTLDENLLRLQVIHIDIADINVVGNKFFSEENIRLSLPLIASGRSPNTKKIASALLLAEENPAKDIRVVFLKGQDPQTVDANISVSDKNPNEIFFWANNAGSELTTDTRLGLQYHNRNLWGRDHQIALSYTVSPEDTGELQQFGVNYRLPLYRLRGMANVFYSQSDVDTGRVADVFDVSGAGETTGIGYTQYLDIHGGYQHKLLLSVVDKLFDNDVLFESSNIGTDVRSRPLSIDYISRFDRTNWLLNSTISHSTNLSGGAFNNDRSYRAARVGAEQGWSKQNLSMRFDYRWNQDWSSRALLFAQTTADSLISGEKFGLGGALGDLGPRGFLEREVMVDEGFKASFEVIRSFHTRRMQLGAFYDYASGDHNNPQVGEPADETLASIGLIYKWKVRPDVSLNIDYGYVLNGVDQAFNAGTDDSDSRLHLSISYYPAWPWSGK